MQNLGESWIDGETEETAMHVFTLDKEHRKGWVINGAWSFTILVFKPPYMKIKVDAHGNEVEFHDVKST